MKRAIKDHLGDFVAIIALFAIAVGIAGYILSNQRLRFPFVEEKAFKVKVELPNAQAVQPGQGQTVRVAGVRIGDIGQVELEDGKAVVTLDLDPEYKGLIREDATALLRPRTGLKDMFVEIDPGRGKSLEENGRVQIANTAPDVNPDEFLQVLDRDTRDYLRLLVSGAGKGLKGRGTDLRETFARLGPLNRDIAKVTKGVARRRANLRRLVNRYGKLVDLLGNREADLRTLVSASNSVFEALASEDQDISAFVAKLPPALRQTQKTLAKVDPYAQKLGPTLESLRPAVSQLDEANEEVLPLFKEGTPILRDQIRPFARIAVPYTRDLGEGAKRLATAAPDLTASFKGLNRFFNMGAYNPGGSQGLTGNPTTDRNRQEGYLYWLGWVAHNTTNLFAVQDAQGPFRRITLGGVNCAILPSIVGGSGGTAPEVGLILAIFSGLGACAS